MKKPTLSNIEGFAVIMPTVRSDKALAYKKIRDGGVNSVGMSELQTKKRVTNAIE